MLKLIKDPKVKVWGDGRPKEFLYVNDCAKIL